MPEDQEIPSPDRKAALL
jgi:hypothetical protein